MLEHALRFDACTLSSVLEDSDVPLCTPVFEVQAPEATLVLAPLEYAAWYGSQRAVQVLARHHPCPACRHNALVTCVRRGHDTLAAWLVDKAWVGLDTALYAAVQHRNTTFLGWLLGYKHVPVDTVLASGSTAMSLAFASQDLEMVDILVGYGATPPRGVDYDWLRIAAVATDCNRVVGWLASNRLLSRTA
jgi:hypothetical protein